MRALRIGLDSVGIGHAAEAAKYGDEGANTLGHILERLRQLQLPTLCSLGLPELVASSVAPVAPVAAVADGGSRGQLRRQKQDGLIFVNVVDFDMLHGQRRDLSGYVGALEEFDHWLGDFVPAMQGEDLLIHTADYGTDRTCRGTGHTREDVPS
jgi:phosphopentomutase